jgi:hypothetical protein
VADRLPRTPSSFAEPSLRDLEDWPSLALLAFFGVFALADLSLMNPRVYGWASNIAADALPLEGREAPWRSVPVAPQGDGYVSGLPGVVVQISTA